MRAARLEQHVQRARAPTSGVFSDGLSTIGAPAAIAGATLCATWLSGWLNGVIAATRRTGSRIVYGPARPAVRRDVAGEHLAVVAQRLHRGEAEDVARALHLVAGVAQATGPTPT